METMQTMALDRLAKLPDELIANILLLASTPTFFQFIQTSSRVYGIAKVSRDVILHHLHVVPGNKLGLDDETNTNDDLFLLLRQRLVKNLYGANFTASCAEWVAQDARIDPNASAIEGFDSDYFRMSLVFKGSPTIRHYTTRCSLKERIDKMLGSDAKIMFLYQRKQFIAILCCWAKSTDERETCDLSDSEDDRCKIWTSAKHNLQRVATYHPDNPTTWPVNGKKVTNRVRYRVLFFDAYSNDEPICYLVDRHNELVPKHFTAYHKDMFAILWDQGDSKYSTKSAQVLKYTATKFSCHEPASFQAKVVWPKPQTPRPSRASNDEEDSVPTKFPKRISFFKEGRRLKLWSEGEVVPYQIVNTESQSWNDYNPTNKIEYDDFTVMVDLPFFGTHATEQSDVPSRAFCRVTHLCLGVSTVMLDLERYTKVLYLMRSKNRIWARNCDHTVSMQRLSHVSAQNTIPVARFWGWQELDTNLTGLETVAISREGTRIAFAMWNKVLVYSLDPSILCEDLVDSDEDDTSSKKKRRKQKNREKGQADDFYIRSKDIIVRSKVAELRPIVLDLDGAIAHKMSWTQVKRKLSEEVDNSNADENEADESKEAEAHSETINSQNLVPQVPVVIEQIVSQNLGDIVSSNVTEQLPIQGTSNVPAETTSPEEDVVPAASVTEPEQVEVPPDNVDAGVSDPVVPITSPSDPDSKVEVQSVPKDLPVSQPVQPATEVNSVPLLPPTTSSHKTSPRKKEKAPEANANEVTPSVPENGLPLLAKTTDKQANVKSVVESTPDLPTISTPTSLAATLPVPQVLQPLKPETLEMSSTTAVEATLSVDHAELATKTELPNSVNMEQTEPSTITAELEGENSTLNPEITNGIAETEETGPIRRKRISEDELLILTDRGIQVWNIGPSGNGTFNRRELRMDESMKGKMPLSRA